MRAQVFGAWASEGPGLRRPGRRGPRTSAPLVRCADGPTLVPAGAAQLPPTRAASVAAPTAPAASSAGNPGASPRRGVSPAACSARTRHSPQRRHSSLGRHGALRGRGKGAQYPTACFTWDGTETEPEFEINPLCQRNERSCNGTLTLPSSEALATRNWNGNLFEINS